jgi:hypothetical protein
MDTLRIVQDQGIETSESESNRNSFRFGLLHNHRAEPPGPGLGMIWDFVAWSFPSRNHVGSPSGIQQSHIIVLRSSATRDQPNRNLHRPFPPSPSKTPAQASLHLYRQLKSKTHPHSRTMSVLHYSHPFLWAVICGSFDPTSCLLSSGFTYLLPPSIPPRYSIQLSETILHVLVERRLVAGVPPTQGWSAFRDVCGSPHDPEFINLASGFVVGNEDIEIASANPVEHEKDGLFSRPCTVRFIADSGYGSTCEPGVCPPRAANDGSAKFRAE